MRTPWRTVGRPPADPDPLELLRAAAVLAREPGVPAEELDPLTGALARSHPDLDLPGAEPALAEAVAALYERGWQPADVVHIAHRRVSRRAAALVAAVVLAQARVSRAAARAPRGWVDQLDALPPAVGLAGWWAGTGVDPATAWRDVARVLALLPVLPPLQRLVPGPAGWPPQRRDDAPTPAGPVDEKVLGRVRALLAKAERTEFPEEADALTGKAQELMSRYAIDSAVLADQQATDLGAGVVARRLHLADPYASAKAGLLHAVAAANGCQVVLLRDLGIATVVGLPVDLELVDLLFTSLLLQATRALADATRAGGGTAVFKRGFLLAYAARVGERLAAAGERATAEAAGQHGGALVPVLARRDAAVQERVGDLFPRLRRGRARTVDPEGWWAGRRAADSADLGSGRSPLPR
ncbi:Protein of unknown function [Klenkia soli]|uniref:Uncharacterized protein n=1 Tax=Klenkia soli TaxID=1052260 RepID=A0A1H0BLC9_9ACTN|nr:DUF2786 domain-containing protein [Klenkia soli]SDN46464.1 Protein of unknown function [Klenkia soli]